MTKASTVLRRALRLLGKNGEHWGKGQLRQGRGKSVKYCVLGAIRQYMDSRNYAILEGPELFLKKALPRSDVYRIVSMWNDEPTRRFSEVKTVFERAIRRAKAQGK